MVSESLRSEPATTSRLSKVKLENNSKLKISVYSTGNAVIEFLSGSQYGSEQAWMPLNSIKLYRTTGELMFDYDTDHTHKTVNAEQVF